MDFISLSYYRWKKADFMLMILCIQIISRQLASPEYTDPWQIYRPKKAKEKKDST